MYSQPVSKRALSPVICTDAAFPVCYSKMEEQINYLITCLRLYTGVMVSIILNSEFHNRFQTVIESHRIPSAGQSRRIR